MIYKYSPNYNSISISDPPSLEPYQRVTLQHAGRSHRLHPEDVAPKD
jgi:hypothetical protein